MKKIFLKIIFPSSILLIIVVFAVCPLGCKTSINEIDVLEGDFSVPHIDNFVVHNSRMLQMDFTKKVQIKNVSAYDMNTEDNYSLVKTTYSDDGKSAFFEMEKKSVVGDYYVLEGLIVDEHGNSLTFSIPFCGYNENPAKVILSEVRNAYGTANVKDEEGISQKVHRSEYVELYVLKSGNLCGIEICSAGDGEEKKYSMPSVEVQSGEYITVHMRTIDADGFDGEGMISELNENLTLSTHEDSCFYARDLWSENLKSCFTDSDIIYLKNFYDNKILDALVFAKSNISTWKDNFQDVVNAVQLSGVWGSEVIPLNGVCSDNITSSAATRSFSRQNIDECIQAFNNKTKITNGKDVWIITSNSGSGKNMISGITPGFKNSNNEYKK